MIKEQRDRWAFEKRAVYIPNPQTKTSPMKNPRLLYLSVLCLSLAFGACSTSRDGLLRLYQHHSGDIINLSVGETMEVVLEGDPGTEIHWLQKPGDPEILQQLGGTGHARR